MEYNGIVLVDKPSGRTSHDIVNDMRHIFETKRVGHTGTLDPMATGVLPICIGSATKASDMLLCEKKSYTAEILFGIKTDTGDITGEVIEEKARAISREELESVIFDFVGKQKQIPPMYSAKKVNGKKLYELAREGKTIERKAEDIEIFSIKLIDFDENSAKIDVSCSKGTYIRVLCEDIGEKLGVASTMKSLTRTASGSFNIEVCHDILYIRELKEKNKLESIVLPIDRFFDYKKITLSEKQSKNFKQGVFVSHPGIAEDEKYRVYDSQGEFFAIGICKDSRLRFFKSFK